MLKKATLGLLISGMVLSNVAQAKENSKIYRIPEDVKCTSATRELFSEDEKAPISKKVTYCTDKEGNPINGQMIKYYQGIALKRYPMKDGYLHGVGKVYYKNGKLKTAFNYKKGVLDGFVLEFDNKWTSGFNGNITEKIPYVNGQREGIATYYNPSYTAKVVYQNDKLNGEGKIWDNEKKIKIYDLGYVDNNLVSATYYYDAKGECEEECTKDHCRVQCDAENLYKCVQKCQTLEGKTKEVKVPPLIIFGINYRCFEIHDRLSADKKPIKYSRDSECNKEWLAQNSKSFSKYLGKAPSGLLAQNSSQVKATKQAVNINDTTTVSADKTLQTSNQEKIKQQEIKKAEATPKTDMIKKKETLQNITDKKEDETSAPEDDCQDLGLPGAYILKENYQTKDKDTVCVVTKDNTENLLQYNKTKELLRIWAPQKACSKAEKILNPESCDASSLLYKFRMGKREVKPKKYNYEIIAGVYAYINQENRQESRKIPPLVIEGINQKCLVLQSMISYSACPFIAAGSSKECNQMWRQQHREEILVYIKGCKKESNRRTKNY